VTRPPGDLEGDFYGVIVSELRQPLTTIKGGVQLARRLLETDPTRAGEELDHVVSQIARVNMMLVELRDRAREAAPAG
jgi:C4-dicarboxylate-specific signal transduction histidine kinase